MRRLESLALICLLALAGCNTQLRANRVDPASFKVEMLCSGKSSSDCPTTSSAAGLCTKPNNKTYALDLGTASAPVSNEQKFYLANVTAIGNDGEEYTPYNGTANVYVMFNGSVSPVRNALTQPAQRLMFKDGKACLQFTMQPGYTGYNQTALWVEDSGDKRNDGSWATGASPAIYRQPPTLEDIQRTTDADMTASPLNLKQVIIKGGANGMPLVVTSVTQSSFTVTDLGADGVDHEWGSLLVYSFSKPYGIYRGMTVKNLAGALSEFNGLTELNFPSWEIDDKSHDESRIPSPHEIKIVNIDDNDLGHGLEKMEPYESALVMVKGWSLCPMNDEDKTTYGRYGQWKIAYPDTQNGNCDDLRQSMSVITNQSVPGFDPTDPKHRGRKFCAIKGILSQVIPGKGVSLWMITPRDASDLGTPVEATQPCP